MLGRKSIFITLFTLYFSVPSIAQEANEVCVSECNATMRVDCSQSSATACAEIAASCVQTMQRMPVFCKASCSEGLTKEIDDDYSSSMDDFVNASNEFEKSGRCKDDKKEEQQEVKAPTNSEHETNADADDPGEQNVETHEKPVCDYTLTDVIISPQGVVEPRTQRNLMPTLERYSADHLSAALNDLRVCIADAKMGKINSHIACQFWPSRYATPGNMGEFGVDWYEWLLTSAYALGPVNIGGAEDAERTLACWETRGWK